MKLLSSLLLTALFAINPRIKAPSPIEQAAREMLTNFTAYRFEAAVLDFNDELRPQVTPAVLADIKQQMDRTVGMFRSVTAVHQRNQDGFRVIELVAKYQRSPVSVRVVFDGNNKVGAVYFNPIQPAPVDPALEKIARGVLTDLMAGRFDDAAKPFDDTMRAQLTPAKLADLNRSILNLYGAVRSITEVRTRVEEPYRIIDVIAACEKMPLAFRVGFDAKNRVAAVHISPNVDQ
ncbi:MAG: uncharacterized protein QOC81_4043 [Thermoanaerobaculia bacterium]|nr:uncharacterized protein [Thermoanaerobaculia bacterium]